MGLNTTYKARSFDLSGLTGISDETLATPIARADHCNNPLPSKLNPRDDLREGAEDPYCPPVEPWQEPPPGNRACGWHGGHPRDVRIIPPSRDFH